VLVDSWSNLVAVLVAGSLAYAGLLVAVRISGKRTLAKLNAFDLVVTVALGSTLATVLLDRGVSLAAGLLALVLLVALQFLVAALSVRSPRVRRWVKAEPTLLLHRGELLPDRLAAQRVSPEEVRQAVRSQGIGGLELVAAVVLETDGSLSVIPATDTGSASALTDVRAP
jgi:uncharacterized membrane protein YcaP (DUF421 family)